MLKIHSRCHKKSAMFDQFCNPLFEHKGASFFDQHKMVTLKADCFGTSWMVPCFIDYFPFNTRSNTSEKKIKIVSTSLGHVCQLMNQIFKCFFFPYTRTYLESNWLMFISLLPLQLLQSTSSNLFPLVLVQEKEKMEARLRWVQRCERNFWNKAVDSKPIWDLPNIKGQ